MSGILNVTRLFVELREGRVHALVLGLAVLLRSWLLGRRAPFRLTVHWRREHLQVEREAKITSCKEFTHTVLHYS